MEKQYQHLCLTETNFITPKLEKNISDHRVQLFTESVLFDLIRFSIWIVKVAEYWYVRTLLH